MSPTTVLTWDPCHFGQLIILTEAHIMLSATCPHAERPLTDEVAKVLPLQTEVTLNHFYLEILLISISVRTCSIFSD